MLKDRRTYEIMRPEDVGVPASTLVLGKHSGRHAVQKRCEAMGVALSRLDVDRVYRQMIALADAHKSVTDVQLAAIVAQVTAGTDAPRAIGERVRAAAPEPATAEAAVMPAEMGYGHGV
jgi:2-isopropylmalate synthase